MKSKAHYDYCDVMELAITLSLRVYHVVPDSVLKGIMRYRPQLHQLYRKAYADRQAGKGRPVLFRPNPGAPITLHGCFLDLGIKFSGGQLVKFGPPRLLAPKDALAIAAQRMLSVETSLPFGVSALAERVVTLALAPPRIRRGPTGERSVRRRRTLSHRRKGARGLV
jgi:hypothetical protein